MQNSQIHLAPKVFLITIFFFWFTASFTYALEEKNFSSICQALNAFQTNEKQSIVQIQNFLKQDYFPKLKITRKNDFQTKYYIKKYQYAFGLETNGKLNEETINFIKKSKNCFDVEKKFLDIQAENNTSSTDKEDIKNNLIFSILSKYIFPEPATVTVATVTIYQAKGL